MGGVLIEMPSTVPSSSHLSVFIRSSVCPANMARVSTACQALRPMLTPKNTDPVLTLDASQLSGWRQSPLWCHQWRWHQSSKSRGACLLARVGRGKQRRIWGSPGEGPGDMRVGRIQVGEKWRKGGQSRRKAHMSKGRKVAPHGHVWGLEGSWASAEKGYKGP